MSLASLTVDLSLGLAKFEADSGKAAQIVTRDMDANARAAKKFEDGLIRMSNAAARVGPEFQIAQAAALGLGDSTVNLIKSLAAGGASFGNIGSRGAAAFAGIAGAAQQAGTESEKRIAAIVSSLREAKAKADALRASAQSENASGSLNEDGFKAKLKGIKDTETAFKELAFAGIQREQAAERVAQAERASAEVQRVSAQKIVDAQNGLPPRTASNLRLCANCAMPGR